MTATVGGGGDTTTAASEGSRAKRPVGDAPPSSWRRLHDDGDSGDDDDDDGDGTTGYDAPDPPTAKAAPKKATPIHPPKYLSIPLYASTRAISGQMFNICPEIAPKMPQILPCAKNA